ncbi:MAG: MlaD family protein [Candidatus Gastranaerophilales bacterium]|nr:MlaD family protein [Candidatus Gastranaerophilales bacterium]
MEKSERKSRTSKIRRIELLVWLAIIVVLATIGIIFTATFEKSYEVHKIFMPDVDGLIVGSPVNLMGIPIGYITKTKILNDEEVIVKFKVTDKTIHIPKGTVATVEFNGLGGSKSLELYPPSYNKHITKELIVNNNDFIIVERPKRLRDCYSLLYQMYQKLMNICYTMASFGSHLNEIEHISAGGSTMDTFNFINYADNWINNSQGNIQTFRKILEKYHSGGGSK